jgi:hypothetical protein
LPIWLSFKRDYTSWQRANLWLIYETLAVGAKNFTQLALWDGVKTDGLGGTPHEDSGATVWRSNGVLYGPHQLHFAFKCVVN